MIDEELQEWKEHTEELIAMLVEDGTNEEVHHTIEHHFSSVDFDTLEKAAITAFKNGFEIEEPEEAELETGEKVFAFDIITEQALDFDIIFDETKKMFELAKQCKVDYDGWGTYFEE
ncbi:ribonuclease E inhibitor RraB [Cognaticolwellia beringensis]|uniref:Regulator of ribonuclease activity B n=1 Tax=Cognaticolwellia beringensis TaxID=1967665 RepID=A0A222G389_9GAMM|nr:ribonuclease E inhibitor RraB [Cognaticolwellia beringensis]ASP46407.1 ribonuclease E inhibitor B [Cognaticolwellia beringensis]|tara:strand:+ start:76 stop:426 length:351 start_codon:yes stop_codon:yes gene_type:complete